MYYVLICFFHLENAEEKEVYHHFEFVRKEQDHEQENMQPNDGDVSYLSLQLQSLQNIPHRASTNTLSLSSGHNASDILTRKRYHTSPRDKLRVRLN